MSLIVASALVVASIFVVAACTLAESALTQARKWRLRDRAAQGDRGARAALEVSGGLDRFSGAARLLAALASVLVGLVVGVLLCEHAGNATIAGRFGSYPGLPVTAVSLGAAAVVLFVVGDRLPRALARGRPEESAARLGRTTRLVSALVSPFSERLRRGADAAARWFGAAAPKQPAATEQQLLDLMREASEAGALEGPRHAICKRAVRFCDRRARALMTPRDQVVWIDVRDSPDEVRRKIAGCAASHFPVCEERLDNLLGIVEVKNLLGRCTDDQGFRIKGILTLPAFIYEGARGPQILDSLKKTSAHTAVVLDEYGSVVGVLTLSDVVDAILGPMIDESSDDDPRAVRRDDGSWLVDGRYPIDEFLDFFQVHESLDDDCNTLGGLVVVRLGRIPEVGEGVSAFGLRLEVAEMDGNRVDRVLVRSIDRPA